MKKTNGNKKIVKRCGSIWREKIVFGRGHGRVRGGREREGEEEEDKASLCGTWDIPSLCPVPP